LILIAYFSTQSKLFELKQLTNGESTELPEESTPKATKEVTETNTPITPSETPISTTFVSQFNGERAYQDIMTQVDFGPRTPGSPAHDKTISYITQQLIIAGWAVEEQESTIDGKIIRNILAYRDDYQATDTVEWIILGTHFDTRLISDRDPDEQLRSQPVPGANDGASGVAVLLELARVLPKDKDLDKRIWLVFFDAEDNGKIPGWDWILGSKAFVNSLSSFPDAAVIIDMVGDRNLDIYIERNSDIDLVNLIWSTAAEIGYSQYFIPLPKRSILDDHTPFIDKEIPAALIIDLDYDYWHTTEDTIDKLSASSLKIVGEVIYAWLTSSEK
jgi:hypothetical protein